MTIVEILHGDINAADELTVEDEQTGDIDDSNVLTEEEQDYHPDIPLVDREFEELDEGMQDYTCITTPKFPS